MKKTIQVLSFFVAATASAETYTPEEFGAVPNDNVDDQAALQAALSALQPGDILQFWPGTYLHSHQLFVTQDDVSLEGRGAVLRATDWNNSALTVQDTDGVIIRHLQLETTASSRSRANRTNGIVVYNSSNFALLSNRVNGFSGAGIMVDHGSDFIVQGNLVHDTFADGIHVTNQSSNGDLLYNTTWDTGDDGLAVVGYVRQSGPNTDMLIGGNSVLNEPHENLLGRPVWHGRGITVEGTIGAIIDNNYIQNTASACVLVASEGGDYNHYPTSDVGITRNTLVACNGVTTTVHGGLLISARSVGPVTNVLVDSNAIIDTVGATSHIRVSNWVTGIEIRNNFIIDADSSHTPWTFYQGSQVVQSGNTYNGVLK